jgi:hypothetical protein
MTWSSAPPPASSGAARKRPWYLVAALVGAWILGATAMNKGCAEIAYYKATDHAELVQAEAETFGPEADHTAVVQAIERYCGVKDGARSRVFPLAVSAFLLGAAMWSLAAGAMANRDGARSALVQVIAVHALVLVLAFAITPDVRAAEAERISKHAALTAPMPRAGPLRVLQRTVIEHSSVIPVLEQSLRLICYALVLVALTRRRTREFFEAARAEH